MSSHRLSLALLSLPLSLSVLLAANAAHAQERVPGFAINRFDPSERGSDWFAADSLDLRGNNRFAIGVVGDYNHDPLAVYNAGSDKQVGAVISDQIYAHFGISYNLADRLRLAVNMPVLFYQAGDTFVVDNQTLTAAKGVKPGDLRLAADLRLFGTYGGPATFTIGGQVYLPTGNQDAYASDGSVRGGPRAMLAGQVGPFVYAARMGVIFRKDHRAFDDTPQGHEAVFAAAAGIKVDNLVIGPELTGSTVLESDAFDRATTPVELLFGGHYRISDVQLGAGVGPGLSRGVGAPDVRVLASLVWAPQPDEPPPPPPPVENPDTDADGILNAVDACPTEPGVASPDSAKNGCPVLDRDKDGVPDGEDICPNDPGPKTDDPKTNGCPPPPDTDKDGIIDEQDACPQEAGVATNDPKTNGCPPPKDSDGDGVMDPEDACPAAPGPKTADPKTNGCPVARLEQNEIRILEPVKFGNNSDKLLPESEPVLGSVMEVLKAHAEITKLEVRGHTDSRGGAAANLSLSKRRAASVMRWLIAHGVDASRLTSNGFGSTRPIDSNETDDGRRNNRRVEFRITATAATP